MSWILVDYNGYGVVEYPTEAEALAGASEAIECYLDDGEWSWEVKEIHILHNNELAYRCVEIPCDPPEDIQEAMDDDPDYVPPADYWCDYVMKPVREISTFSPNKTRKDSENTRLAGDSQTVAKKAQ